MIRLLPIRGGLLTLISLIITACASSPPRETFDLAQARIVAKTEEKIKLSQQQNIQLLIAAPNTLKIFDGQEIVVDRNGSLSYLKGGQFGDRLPNMLQSRLIQAFEDTGRLGGVARPGEGLAINYQILTDIRQFAINLSTNAAQAKIALSIKIVDDRNGQVRAMRIFETSSPILGNDNQAYVQGLERSLAALLAQIVNWAFDYL